MARNPSELQNEYAAKLGALVASYTLFEDTIHRCIWALAGVDETVGDCIMSEIMSHGPKFRILIALMHHRGFDKTQIAKANKMSEYVVTISKERNKYVHGILGMMPVDDNLNPVTFYSRNSGGFKKDMIPYSPEKMDELKMKLWKLIIDAGSLLEAITCT